MFWLVVQCARQHNNLTLCWLNNHPKPTNQLTQNDSKPHKSVTFYRWWPVGLLLLVLTLRWLLPAWLIESAYSRGLFVGLRSLWDYTLPLLPIPLFYVFWVAVLAWLVRTVLVFRRGRRMQGKVKGQWRSLARKFLNGAAMLVVVFLLGWGFNYGRLPVEQGIGFERYQPTLDELRQRVYDDAAELAVLRQKISSDSAALGDSAFPPDLEPAIRSSLATALKVDGYPAAGRPRVRQLVPKGILLRLSTAGVYWPWAGEGNIDAGLHPLQKPAVMAHELAHAYGFGDEGTCTFWAWLAGRQTTDPAIHYAIQLSYWRRLAGKLRQQEPDAYWAWRAARLDPGIRNDLQAIYDNSELYKDIAPVVRDAAYDTYLKAQGIHEGLLNYGTVVQLVEGYRRR